MATGIGSTLIIKETKNKTLEDLSNENQDGFVEGVVAPVEIQDGIVVDRSMRHWGVAIDIRPWWRRCVLDDMNDNRYISLIHFLFLFVSFA